MRKRVTFEGLKANVEFYVECPACDKELIVTVIFANIKCPACGWIFKPSKILSRRKTQKNPSFREFSTGVEVNAKKDRTQVP